MLAERVRHFGTTIFAEMTALANQHGAVNLGQGFPDFAAPDFLKDAAIQAIQADLNQYAPSTGRERLRQAIANKVKNHYGLEVDPAKEIVITHGATEAIFTTILGLVNPGDEVILFEPFYDSYVPSIQMAGGIPRFCTLNPPDWSYDPAGLESLFSPKTRLILINTPHNPTGKVYSYRELNHIAELCQRYDVLAVVDEVYEHILFDSVHYSLAAMPGMAGRTITISSLGKTFSATGWKVGWAIARPELCQAIYRVHQFTTFCGVTPMQEATALALEMADQSGYYAALSAMYRTKRDFLAEALDAAGLKPILPSGTYFIMADISHLGFANDVAFCRYLTTEIGVAAIPPSAFYHRSQAGAGLARFAFCKGQATLELAANRLRQIAIYD